MPAPKPIAKLCTIIKVVVDRATFDSEGRPLSVRRLFPLDRENLRPIELHLAYLNQAYQKKAFNTQLSILADLALYREWCILRRNRDMSWRSPELRAVNGDIPISKLETQDFAGWMQQTAQSLAEARVRESGKNNVIRIAAGRPVMAATTTRRLPNVLNYIIWSLALGTGEKEDGVDDISRAAVIEKYLRRNFEIQYSAEPAYDRPRSLTESELASVRNVLNSASPSTPCGERDSLILRFLLEGLRAGELLKVQTDHVTDSYEVSPGKTVGVVRVRRNPNCVLDERVREPAVKTLDGDLPISRKLAEEALSHVRTSRRLSVDMRPDGFEPPYLFVCHAGKNVGKPISQRNLNRIVANFRGKQDIPQSLIPHVLRHTHFTELEAIAHEEGKSAADTLKTLEQRGRWAPNSSQPAYYTKREINRQSADLVAKRDEILARK